MRTIAASTANAIKEQTQGGQEIASAMEELNRAISIVASAMLEQVSSTAQIGKSVDGIRKQSVQVTQAMDEQARATRDATQAAVNVSQQVKMVTEANIRHSMSAENILKSIAEVRTITDQNGQGVVEARTVSESLKLHTRQLIAKIEALSLPATTARPRTRTRKSK